MLTARGVTARGKGSAFLKGHPPGRVLELDLTEVFICFLFSIPI